MDPVEKKKRFCVVPVCKSERFDLVHKFPMSDIRTSQWLSALDIPLLYLVPPVKLRKSYFVCSRHFRPKDYKNSLSRELNQTAVPCINIKNLDDIDLVLQRSVLRPPNLVVQNNLERANVPRKLVAGNDNPEEVRQFPVKKEIEHSVKPEKRIQIKVENKLDKVFMRVASKDGIPSQIYFQSKQPEIVATVLENPSNISANENIMVENDFEEELIEQTLDDESIAIDYYQMDDTEDILEEEMDSNFSTISIPNSESPLVVDNFWLRDHCRCTNCYNYKTFQRRYNLIDIPVDIKPIRKTVVDNKLTVVWSDNHESQYDIDFLCKSTSSIWNGNCESTKELWNLETVKNLKYARVPFNDYLTNDDVAKEVVSSLIKFGFAFIEKIPATVHMTETAVRRLFPIQKSFFGEMWTFSDRHIGHSDTAYTAEYLSAHTDNTYFNDASGLQIFHCLKEASIGGETLLVDGFNVVKNLKTQSPEAFENLCKVHVPAEYIDVGRNHKHSAPIISCNQLSGDVEQVRYNLYDRAVFDTIPQSEMTKFYKNFRLLIEEVQSPENEWWFKLSPGTVLIFDNWRVLHGRKAYEGLREITGCYVSRTEFLSTARTMGVID